MKTTDYNIPVNSPFLAQMMPRLGAAVRMYASQLELSQHCIDEGHKLDQIIVPQVKSHSIAIKELELQIFDLCLSDPASSIIEQLMQKLSILKLELSQIQLHCVTQLFSAIPRNDAVKLKKFFLNQRDTMVKHHGFMF